MAIITFSPLIVAASGKVQDTVFSRWKGRPYIRSRVTPANPKSAAQVKQRAISTAGVANWQTLHADLIAAWNAYASPYSISGYNAWQARNTSTALPGGDESNARMELAAALLPALMQPTPGAKELDITSIVGTADTTITVTWTIGDWLAADSVYIALWDEAAITYYGVQPIIISKTAANVGSKACAGLINLHDYTVAVIAHHAAEDHWTINDGDKAVTASS